MHELALAQNILNIATQAAQRAGLRRVRLVNVCVGELAVVLPEALHTAFAATASVTDGVCASAQLQLLTEPGRAWCTPCAAEVVIHDALDACPQCGGYVLRVTGGQGLRVIDIEGED